MAKGRELRSRIKPAENTRKSTRTRDMVATPKMKRAQDRVIAARPYARALTEVVASLHRPDLAEEFPLLRQPRRVAGAAVPLLTSDRGLAGAFNATLIKHARALVAHLEHEGAEVELHVVGRKGIGWFRYVGRAMKTSRTDISDRPTAADAASLVGGAMGDSAPGALCAVHVVYAQFRSALSSPPARVRVLPVTPPARSGALKDHLLYRSASALLTEVLPPH